MWRVVGAAAVVGVLFVGCMSWDPQSDDAWEDPSEAEADIIPRSEMKNPFARSKVGDWIMLRGKGLHARQIKTEVTRVSDREVQFMTGNDPTDEEAYEAIDLQEEERNYKPPEKLEGFVSMTERTMDLGGKTIRTKVYTLKGEGVTIVNTFSEDVPLDGMVKSVRNGEIGYQILDFNKN